LRRPRRHLSRHRARSSPGGFTSHIDRYPDDRLTAIVLTNLAPPRSNPGRVAFDVAALYVPELGEKNDK